MTLFSKKFNLLSLAVMVFSISLIVSHDYNVFAQSSSAPDAITDLIAVPGNGEAHLSWTAPENNGSPIISYKIVSWETGSDIFTTFPNLSTSTHATATGLKNGISYSFKVITINSAGASKDSNIASTKPSPSSPSTDVPNMITDFLATRGDGKVNLSWTKPNDNGSPISSYKITYWQIGINEFNKKTVDGKAISAQITGLTNEVSYAFKINAVNSIGQSPDSNVDSATPSKSAVSTIPNQVRGVVAIPSSGQIFLSWIEPSDNGSPITSYRITVNEKGSTTLTTYPNIGDTTTATILGLKNNVSYDFKVSAVNSIGIGKESKAVSATPNNKVPIAITGLKVIPGDGQVKLSWSVSSSALEDITGYTVREFKTGSDSFVSHSIIGKSTSITIDSLTNGIPYGFRVLGVNADGIGPESNIVYATPMPKAQILGKVPAQIGDLRATPGDNQVKLEWTKPFDNGFPITGYKIIQTQTGSSIFTTIQKSDTTNNAIVTELTNDVSYNFKISAMNSEGTGKESISVSAIPKSTSSSKIIIPQWVKTNAGWWSQGLISDLEYAQAIEYLINQGIVKIK
ncbi:MAG: fibronectin type III domain-containing protein [Nitrosopumilus sp.]|uniref:fibronectin type III domain-containing protein n=1 Tax=Nitrosopumilus sp. TaxID=2024843 RepID=UPI002472598A|nr:fibronectin type III domain-containing protein [Nitrosopumilus sp.]MDH5431717.1 fibronectin type III domain-containing protein [Nitrosopumilus sp.]